MKKIFALLIFFVICISFCSCTPISPVNTISYNDDATEMYYNGHTYINFNNYNGKYCFNLEDDNWINIATMPYGYFYILDAVTVYYGNDAENPDFITNSRTIDFYVREDLSFDRNTELSLCDAESPYCFKISEITTGNVIEYVIDKEEQFTKICDFNVAFEQYPYVMLWIQIYEYDGKLYFQDVWDSDYYEITDEFKEDIYRLGLNTSDYHQKEQPLA